MLKSVAQIDSPMAARYLIQLCKHFEHRVAVTYADGHGTIAFPAGLCTLDAEGDRLKLQAEAADETALAQLEDVVARHLKRFAFRDEPAIAWDRAA